MSKGKGVQKRSARRLDALLRRELTAREMAIVRLVAGGLRNREIAARLAVTGTVVKIDLQKVFRKLKVKSRRALTLLAQRKGIGS